MIKYIFFSLLFLLTVQISFAQQKPIVKNAANGIFIFCGKEIPASLHYKIERKLVGESDFNFVDETYMPSNINAFNGKLMQWNAACPFYEQPTTEKMEKAFALFQSYNSIDSVFYFNSVPLYLYASGNAFLDVSVEEGKSYIYKITYGNESKITDAFTFKKEVLKVKAGINSKIVLGSNVQLKWYVKQVDKNNPPHVAKVFRSDNLQTPLKEIDALCGFQYKQDSLFAILYDTVIDKRFYYSYCMKMYDKFGNESAMSDTVSLLNIFENTVPVIHVYSKSNASKRGIDLSWNFKNTPGVRSIDVYKSLNFDDGFQLIHSANSTDTVFTDIDVKPIISYYYYIQINGLFEKGNKSATVSGMLKTAIAPAAPINISANQKERGIELTWNRVGPFTRGYYVFRGLNYHPTSMQQVSGLLVTDSTQIIFTDTTNLDFGRVYSYCVKAVSVGYTIGKSSDTVGTAYMKLEKNYDFTAPASVWVKQIGNVAKIVWQRDTTNLMITGYELLRREFKNDKDEKLATWNVIADDAKLKNHSSYIDSTVKILTKYEYAVKAKYAMQFSEPSVATQFEMAYEKPTTPAALQAYYTGNSILIRWGKIETKNIKSIKIYRSDDASADKLISTINSSEESFNDKNIIVGKEYDYYLIVLDNNGVESTKSGIVTILAK
jgi:fibronectin type 3 domain-containing protein